MKSIRLIRGVWIGGKAFAPDSELDVAKIGKNLATELVNCGKATYVALAPTADLPTKATLEKMNRANLEAVAFAEGVELSALKTNKEIAKAILDSRPEEG